MLGWFKKKFNKTTDSDSAEKLASNSAETAAEELSAEVEVVEQDQTQSIQSDPTMTEHDADNGGEDVQKDSTAPGSEEATQNDAGRAAAALPGNASEIPEAASTVRETSQATVSQASEAETSSFMFRRLSDRLSRTRESFTNRIDELFLGKKHIDAELFDDLEEILITADIGIATTQELLEYARKRVTRDELSEPQALKAILKDKIKSFILDSVNSAEMVMPEEGPFVIMVIGVNGVGKTTTIGKITRKFIQSGQTVLLVAADTFRAAAVSQLKIWGERNNVRVVSQHEGADPSSVVFDAIAVARSKQYDVVLVDTAGRLHTQANLMEELKKIKRVMGKQLAGAPHEILLVIDATTGQNGISQATLFNEAVGVTGIALTKLDGTAKGGIVANIARELKMPIRFIGVGEQVEDLRDFDADDFIDALFDSGSNS